MELKYDDRADCVYIRFSSGEFARTELLDDRRNVDYAADGSVIGVEILYPRLGIDVSGLPREVSVGRFLEEHGFSVVSPQQS